MICYFDTSAFVPLLGPELSTKACQELWTDADSVVTSRMLYVEAASAIAQAERIGRISRQKHRAGLAELERLWRDLAIIEAGVGVVRRAAEIAYIQSLRGYDAIHCASAESLPDSDLIVASGDRKLLQACRGLGLSTADVNAN